MTKLSQEKISELNLVGRINNRMLNGMGINLVKGEFEQLPNYKDANPLASVEQFNYIMTLLSKVLSGINPSDKVEATAKLYLFDKYAYSNDFTNDRATKYNGKRLAVNRVIPAHDVLSSWPNAVSEKIDAIYKVMGGRKVNEQVKLAAISYFVCGQINKCAIDNGVSYVQVKNMINKVEQFDLAAKEYGDL